MVATAFPINEGYQYLVNQTNITIIKAVTTGWQSSGFGIAGFLIFSFLIILAGTMIYIRTNKIVPTAFIMILLSAVINYYGLLEMTVFGWHPSRILTYISTMIICGIAIWLVKMWLEKD